VLLLLTLRLPWRWRHPVSPIETPAPAWMQMPALLAKIALYALMFALPVLGIAVVQAHGESVTFIGFILPDVFRSLASSQRTVKEIHEWMGDAIMRRCRSACRRGAVASLHVARRHAAENAGRAQGRKPGLIGPEFRPLLRKKEIFQPKARGMPGRGAGAPLKSLRFSVLRSYSERVPVAATSLDRRCGIQNLTAME
jgi:hypothetical protein